LSAFVMTFVCFDLIMAMFGSSFASAKWSDTTNYRTSHRCTKDISKEERDSLIYIFSVLSKKLICQSWIYHQWCMTPFLSFFIIRKHRYFDQTKKWMHAASQIHCILDLKKIKV
jgi:hypothetical protein